MELHYLKRFEKVSSFYTWKNHISINFTDKESIESCIVDGVMQDVVDAHEACLYNGWLRLSNHASIRFVNLMQPEWDYVIHPGQKIEGLFNANYRGVDKDRVIIEKNMQIIPQGFVSFEFLWYDLTNDEVITTAPKRIPMTLHFLSPWGPIFVNKGKFALYSDEFELCWELDFNKYKKPDQQEAKFPKHLLGPWQDKLYVVVHYKKPGIMEIDPLSGAVLREWSKLPEGQTYAIRGLKYDVIPYLERTFLDEEKNVLGCLSEIAYWEIDLRTGEFNMVNLQQMFEELELSSIKGIHDSDYVYFTAKIGESLYPEHSKLYLGAYNRHTHQIDELYSNPEWSKDGWFYEIGKAGNRIYIKQGREYLHVFEKN